MALNFVIFVRYNPPNSNGCFIETRAKEHRSGLSGVSSAADLGATDSVQENRKIDPSRGTHLRDGSPNNDDRIEIGPTQLAYAE